VSIKRARPERIDRIRIVGNLDPHDVEALQLELLRLAKRYGRIKDLQIETSTTESDGRSA
jgi:septum formation topological specificity factor MinE